MISLPDRRSRRRRWSAEEKASYLAAFRESGLSGAAFCRDAGIPPSTFELWKRDARQGRRQPPGQTVPAPATPAVFARVALVPSQGPTGRPLASPMRLVVRSLAGHEATLDGVDDRTAVQVIALVLGASR